MAFTVDQGADMERCQGIVPLEGDTLADAALGYFDRSEQIGTAIKLAAAPPLLAGRQNRMARRLYCGAANGCDRRHGDVTALSLIRIYIDDDWNRLKIAGRPPSRANYWMLMSAASNWRLACSMKTESGI